MDVKLLVRAIVKVVKEVVPPKGQEKYLILSNNIEKIIPSKEYKLLLSLKMLLKNRDIEE